MTAYDALILNVYDMFEGTVYYMFTDSTNITANDQTNLRESLGSLNLGDMSEDLREVIQNLDSVVEFPYEAFRTATNPKVLSIILD